MPWSRTEQTDCNSSFRAMVAHVGVAETGQTASFGYRILYGPEQYQHYWVGRDAGGKHWESVYVGRRGNGKVYYLVASTNCE